MSRSSAHSNVIIVGGGTAGALLAAHLSTDPSRTVTVLEKGQDYPTSASLPVELRFGYLASGSNAPGCPSTVRGSVVNDLFAGSHVRRFLVHRRIGTTEVPRGEVIGGSSAVNNGIYLWGTPEDYDHWAALGNTAWSHARVVPSFADVESDLDFRAAPHGTTGPIPVRRARKDAWHPLSAAFVAACRGLGHAEVADFNDPLTCPSGVGPLPFNVELGQRISAAMAYLDDDTRRRDNLRIVSNVLVSRILFEGHRAIGVVARRDGREEQWLADEVILAAGSIASPQLLLLSGVGPVAELAKHGIPVTLDLPGVGENLQDHPAVRLLWRTRELAPAHDPNGSEVAVRYTTPSSPYRNDVQINCATTVRDPRESTFVIDPNSTGWYVHLYRTEGTGTLRLNDTDPATQPKLDYRYLEHDGDRARMRLAVRHGFEIAASASFRELIISPNQLNEACGGLTLADAGSNDTLDRWMLSNVGTGQHTCGTCKMGPANDEAAVVDQQGRVHGLTGVRVVDSSIMPTCIRANTNAPTLMLAQHITKLMASEPSH